MGEVNTKHHRGRRSKKKKGSILSTIILLVALAVFLVSGYQLYKIYSEYNRGSSEYDKVKDLAIKENKEDKENKGAFTVDFDALAKINSDIAGWIRFDQPEEINYPVVQGKDNQEYLRRTFEANDNKLGTLFIDAGNQKDFSDRNTIIYGHNMKNGSMFAKLMNYKEESYYKENPYFYMYTPDGKESKYQIFSAGIIKDTAENYKKEFATEEEYETYLKLCKSTSGYDTGVEVTKDSKIISLSTCTNVKDDERFLVQGVKISEK